MHDLTETASVRKAGKGRLFGIDGARGLALVGMMAVHILPNENPDGSATWYYVLTGGKSSALFAVLAGVGLALANGRETPPRGRAWRASAAASVGRALLLVPIGLFLGELSSGVAVILVHYALLFSIGAVLLGLPRRWLIGLAALWAVGAPLLSHLWRSLGDQPSAQVPGFDSLLNPAAMLGDLFLTGYYPVLPWITYLLAGLAIGRSSLAASRTSWSLLSLGAALAVGSWVVSAVLLGPLGGAEAIGDIPGQYSGTTPTTSLWYLAVATPHSGTPFDLILTIGTAMTVIGLCLLIARVGKAAIGWLAAAGGMTFSLYTGHVLAMASEVGFDNRPALYWWHAIGALLLGFAWRYWVGRGPLETLSANIANALRGGAEGLASPRAG
ncbi:MAG: heparan-alpha-glucosaminide N-acetyltransferase domain-containing protein [Acidimicrobiia bacterium]